MITQTKNWSCKTVEISNLILNTEEGRLKVEYELVELSRREKFYFILINAEGDCELAPLGSDKARAFEVFEILRNNSVTPCTLSECLNEIKF